MCHTQQSCGWDIAYKRLGPHGTNHVLATSRNHAIKWLTYSPQTPLGSVETIHKNCCRRPGHHNAQIFTQTMCNHQMQSIQCPEQHTHHPVPHGASAGPHWLPDKVTWPIFRNYGAVMPGNPRDLVHLTVWCTEQNAAINFSLANDDLRQIANLTNTKQFLWAVFIIIKFPLKLMCVSFFAQYIKWTVPDSKLLWPHVGPTWILSAPRWANVDPTCLAVWGVIKAPVPALPSDLTLLYL